MLKIEIQDVPARRIAALRHLGPYADAGPAFQSICSWALQRGLFHAKTQVIGVFHDDPEETPAGKLRCDAGITVPLNFTGDTDAGICPVDLPAGKCAVVTVKGPYESLDQAYAWIYGEGLPATGASPSDAPSYEVYLNDPQDTPKAELLTAIHIPLE